MKLLMNDVISIEEKSDIQISFDRFSNLNSQIPKGDLCWCSKNTANLKKNRELRRKVDQGTFFGAKPIDELSVVGRVAEQSNPMDLMSAKF